MRFDVTTTKVVPLFGQIMYSDLKHDLKAPPLMADLFVVVVFFSEMCFLCAEISGEIGARVVTFLRT